jgi:hypothetical protein
MKFIHPNEWIQPHIHLFSTFSGPGRNAYEAIAHKHCMLGLKI